MRNPNDEGVVVVVVIVVVVVVVKDKEKRVLTTMNDDGTGLLRERTFVYVYNIRTTCNYSTEVHS